MLADDGYVIATPGGPAPLVARDERTALQLLAAALAPPRSCRRLLAPLPPRALAGVMRGDDGHGVTLSRDDPRAAARLDVTADRAAAHITRDVAPGPDAGEAASPSRFPSPKE